MSRPTSPGAVGMHTASVAARPVRRGLLRVGVLCLILVGLGACGVPAQPDAQRISVDRISLAVRKPERSVTTFVLVGGSKLYGRPDCIPLTLDLKQSAIAEMVNLRKPLSAADAVNFDSSVNRYELSVDSVDVNTGTVIVDVSKAPEFKKDYLAIGQVVKSLTSIKGIELVGLIEKVESEGRSVEQLLPSVKMAGLVDGRGVKNGELLLPASKDSFDAVESSLLRFWFFETMDSGAVKLRRGNKYVIGFEGTEAPKIQANKYFAELELGPTVETVAQKATRERFAGLGAQVEQTDDRGPLALLVSSAFDKLSPSDQAAALGQLLLTLELIPSFAELPPVEFYVHSESSTNSPPQRRTRVPNANGEIVDRETLSPRDYDALTRDYDKSIEASNKEIASSRECR